MRPLNVRLVRINYRHWGEHSGINQFARYLDPKRIRISEQRVPLQPNEPHRLDRLSKRVAAKLARGRRVNWYTSADFIADVFTFFRAATTGIDVIHYLDGEHSLGFLPDLLRHDGLLERPPRIVTTFHQPSDWLGDIVRAENLANVDRVTVVAEEQAQFFRDLAPRTGVSRIHHGIDIDFFHPPECEKEDGPFRCITVGAWLRDHDLLFELARRFAGKSGFEFHLVSPGIDGPPPPNVTRHDGVSDEALRALYHDADVLLLPLRNATANNALLEGIACGLPVVTTDLPGVRDYVPGDEAIRIESNDPDRFEETLLRLRGDREERRHRSRLARERALLYGWEKIAPLYESLYEEVVLSGRTGEEQS